MLNDQINRRGYQAGLPDESNHNIEHVARKVLVLLEGGILGTTFLINRAPEAPGTNSAIEALQHFVAFRLGQQAKQNGGGEAYHQNQEEAEHRMNRQIDL